MSDTGAIIVASVILAIAFTGEPDLVDSIIYHLAGTQDGWMETQND